MHLFRHTFTNLLKSKGVKWQVVTFNILLIIALSTAFFSLQKHQHTVEHYSKEGQNAINFSKTILPNNVVRFGEISAALILQLLLPLFIFFGGFVLVEGKRELETLRLVLSQGVSFTELLIGETMGLFFLSLTLLIPSSIIALKLLLFNSISLDVLLSFSLLVFSFLLYLLVMSLLSAWISALFKTSKTALIRLVGCWLFFTLMLPNLFSMTLVSQT